MPNSLQNPGRKKELAITFVTASPDVLGGREPKNLRQVAWMLQIHSSTIPDTPMPAVLAAVVTAFGDAFGATWA
jgi:hypothetical protein